VPCDARLITFLATTSINGSSGSFGFKTLRIRSNAVVISFIVSGPNVVPGIPNTWFSTEVGKKGQIKAGQLADLVVLSDDYFSVPGDAIQDITSVLTLLGGKAVYGDAEFKDLAPPLPPARPTCVVDRNADFHL
jgi:hypothetical protein